MLDRQRLKQLADVLFADSFVNIVANVALAISHRIDFLTIPSDSAGFEQPQAID